MLTKEQFSEKCHTAIKTVAPKIRSLTAEDNSRELPSLGLDSLDIMSFLLELESSLQVSIGEVNMKQFNTIDKLYEYYTKL